MYPERSLPARLGPIDYLLIGHISRDLDPAGDRIGGTVTYAGLTALALGMRVGIVTSWAEDLADERLGELTIYNHFSKHSTTFENTYSGNQRIQVIHHRAEQIDYYHVPELWRKAPLVHVGPVAGEVEAGMLRYFPDSQLFITPQGWLRDWDADGNIFRAEWPEARIMLRQVDAAVISQEDVNHDLDVIEGMAEAARVLVVTDGPQAAQLYFEGRRESIIPEPVDEIDPTGAGDIFAAAFFISYHKSGDALKAAQFASRIAALGVSRVGLESIPTQDEIFDLLADLALQPE
jgi:hypothetical protein